jgi:hypothetical protein
MDSMGWGGVGWGAPAPTLDPPLPEGPQNPRAGTICDVGSPRLYPSSTGRWEERPFVREEEGQCLRTIANLWTVELGAWTLSCCLLAWSTLRVLD